MGNTHTLFIFTSVFISVFIYLHYVPKITSSHSCFHGLFSSFFCTVTSFSHSEHPGFQYPCHIYWLISPLCKPPPFLPVSIPPVWTCSDPSSGRHSAPGHHPSGCSLHLYWALTPSFGPFAHMEAPSSLPRLRQQRLGCGSVGTPLDPAQELTPHAGLPCYRLGL